MTGTDPSGSRPIETKAPDGEEFDGQNYVWQWSAADRERGSYVKVGDRSFETAQRVVGTDGGDLTADLTSLLQDIRSELQLAREARELPETQDVRAILTNPKPDLWQVRTQLVTVPGITTQTTAYAAADAVGFPFRIYDLGGPYRSVCFIDAMVLFDIVPTTTAAGIELACFAGPVADGTDNGPVSISDQELLTATGVLRISTGGGPNLWANNAMGFMTGDGAIKGRAIPTAADGSLTIQAYCTTAFTIAAGGKLYVKLVYRYANFQGVA